MIRNIEKEEQFYSNDKFKFSYSSLNKLLFSPSLFYKDYILNDREVRTDKHLVEGKLVHCLVFEPEKLDEKFNIVPGKSPSDNIRKVLKDMSFYTDAKTLAACDDETILDSLKNLNLFQSLKVDESRIAKVRTEDNEPYWKFLSNSNVDVVDQDALLRCEDQAENIKSNSDVMAIFEESQTDFELDPIETHAERYLSSSLTNMPFGLHGYIDYYKVNHTDKTITICDLKTTGKTIADFRETVEFYNYWLQAAIYSKLVYENMSKEVEDIDSYKIFFKFVVVDKYGQVYPFDVTDETLNKWAMGLLNVIKAAEFHYNERNYSLPYEFLAGKVKL
tara:strand:- start:675 stop:1673 length:999 start_codon:yes stop_codon:yes gene_type:complete